MRLENYTFTLFSLALIQFIVNRLNYIGSFRSIFKMNEKAFSEIDFGF